MVKVLQRDINNKVLTVVTPTYVNGLLTKVEEKEGISLKTSTTLTYNSDGAVNTITEVIDGMKEVTNLTYVNGEFNSAVKVVL